jgi:hypothetical protein
MLFWSVRVHCFTGLSCTDANAPSSQNRSPNMMHRAAEKSPRTKCCNRGHYQASPKIHISCLKHMNVDTHAGDAYMIVAQDEGHAARMCGMAIDMIRTVRNVPCPDAPDEHIEVRIGIHSGPVCTIFESLLLYIAQHPVPRCSVRQHGNPYRNPFRPGIYTRYLSISAYVLPYVWACTCTCRT